MHRTPETLEDHALLPRNNNESKLGHSQELMFEKLINETNFNVTKVDNHINQIENYAGQLENKVYLEEFLQ